MLYTIENWAISSDHRTAIRFRKIGYCPSVPVQTVATACNKVESNCLNHREHEQLIVSSVAFVTDACMSFCHQAGGKRR